MRNKVGIADKNKQTLQGLKKARYVVLGYFVSSRRGFVSLARACPDRADT